MAQPEPILFVDDDANLLQAVARVLHGSYKLELAQGPEAALDRFKSGGLFPVVVTDMRMPGMSGIDLICRFRAIDPNAVYLILTGNADQQTAIDAVNRGHIFRFLTKPCPPETLKIAIDAALRQYRLENAERDLLQKTLTGSVRALMEVLNVAQPIAYRRSQRVAKLLKFAIQTLNLGPSWQIELAAMLSQLGCVVLPTQTLERLVAGQRLNPAERAAWDAHPQTAAKLIEHIPRLEYVARIVALQASAPPVPPRGDLAQPQVLVSVGGHLLRCCLSLEDHAQDPAATARRLAEMRTEPQNFHPEAINALAGVVNQISAEQPMRLVSVSCEELAVGMIASDDVRATNGLLLLLKGTEITPASLERLVNFHRSIGVQEPVKVLIPDDPTHN